MLLSKPKKCYKSVSKTDLIADQEKGQEEDQKVDIFAYEEMNINQDLVRKSLKHHQPNFAFSLTVLVRSE